MVVAIIFSVSWGLSMLHSPPSTAGSLPSPPESKAARAIAGPPPPPPPPPLLTVVRQGAPLHCRWMPRGRRPGVPRAALPAAARRRRPPAHPPGAVLRPGDGPPKDTLSLLLSFFRKGNAFRIFRIFSLFFCVWSFNFWIFDFSFLFLNWYFLHNSIWFLEPFLPVFG